MSQLSTFVIVWKAGDSEEIKVFLHGGNCLGDLMGTIFWLSYTRLGLSKLPPKFNMLFVVVSFFMSRMYLSNGFKLQNQGIVGT